MHVVECLHFLDLVLHPFSGLMTWGTDFDVPIFVLALLAGEHLPSRPRVVAAIELGILKHLVCVGARGDKCQADPLPVRVHPLGRRTRIYIPK